MNAAAELKACFVVEHLAGLAEFAVLQVKMKDLDLRIADPAIKPLLLANLTPIDVFRQL